jgi:hypothetical protein
VREPIRRFIAFHILAAALALVFFAAIAQRTSAGTLNTSVVGMFPKEVGEFAYADLKSARKFPWFTQLRDQILPSRFRDFEKFLVSAGVDPDSQVDELAWGAINTSKETGEQIVGVAMGTFDTGASEDRFKAQKLPMFDVHGYHLWAFGSGVGPGDILFTFIDSNTAAFGHRAALEKLIDVRTGVAESLLTNDQLFPLINEVNGSGIIWGVLNQSYAQLAMKQLIPQVAQFPQAAPIIGRISAMTISIDADDGIDAHFQAVCGSTEDANLLSAGMQAALMMRRYQETTDHPDLAGALDQVQVSPSGDRLKVNAPVTQDQLLALIRTRAFAAPM